MDKFKMESADMTEKNIEKISVLFPNVITEMEDEKGKLKKGINFELLKQELSGDVIDSEECYDFTWVGKKAAIVEGNKPIRKTLRPCIEESKDWENTENLYIEGENIDILKLLQESYLNSIKMIYIDPPYNTGKDSFVYPDNFEIEKDDYDERIGLYDENENRLFQNNESNGRFHSDWCSMLYPRLKLAQNLLADDGVIFISIDDNEVHNLRIICNEIFGESNFVGTIIWKKRYQGAKEKHLVVLHEYILVYTKNLQNLPPLFIPSGDEYIKAYYTQTDEYSKTRGPFRTQPLEAGKSMDIRQNLMFAVIAPDGTEIRPKRQWIWSKEHVEEAISNHDIGFSKNKNGLWGVYIKQYLKSKNGEIRKTKPFSIIDDIYTQHGTKEMEAIFGDGNIFSFPKPSKLLSKLITLVPQNEDMIILDFFSGSATTAHAAMQLNAEDGGNRKFIMVQLPEACDENSEAYKAGYKNICEIGKERIRRAGENIKSEVEQSNKQLKFGEEPKKIPDIGFRVLKLDSTNMKDVYYGAAEYDQTMLDHLVSNVKDDRTDMDLLYGVLLEWGLPLSLPHKIEQINGVTVHTVNEGDLIACFANKINESVIREIAKRQPLRAVFRDSCFVNSPDKINVEEIFKLMAPKTTVKVI